MLLFVLKYNRFSVNPMAKVLLSWRIYFIQNEKVFPRYNVSNVNTHIANIYAVLKKWENAFQFQFNGITCMLRAKPFQVELDEWQDT